MILNSRKFLSFLVFLWIPVSCGNIMFLNKEIGPLSLQNITTLFFYFCAFFIFFLSERKFYFDRLLILFLCFIFFSGLILNFGSIYFFLKFGSLIGVIIFSKVISACLPFERLLQVLFHSVIFFLGVSILFTITFPDLSLGVLQNRTVLSSFYYQKNTFGRFLYFSFFFLLLSLRAKTAHQGYIYIAIATSICLLFFTDSRTSLAIAIIIFLLLKYSNVTNLITQNIRSLVVFFITTLALLLFSGAIHLYNVGSIFDGVSVLGIQFGLTGRATIWNSIFENLTFFNSIFGYGLESYFKNNQQNFQNIGLGDFIPNDAHNGYIDLFVNIGFLGATLYLLIIAKFFKLAEASRNRLLATSAITFMIVFLLSNLTESFFIKTSNISSFMFWLFYFYLSKADDVRHVRKGVNPSFILTK